MKILFITEYLSPQINGIAIRCENMVRNFRKLGHTVTVYGPQNCPTSDNKLLCIINPFYVNSVVSIDSCFELCKDILENNYDIIHIISPPALFAIPVIRVAKFVNIPVVVSNHVDLLSYVNHYLENDIIRNIMRELFTEYFYRPQLKGCNLMLAPDQYNDISRIFGTYVHTLPSGIDTGLFKYSQKKDKKLIVYTGRIAPEKNIYRLLDLFLLVHNSYKLMIIGNGVINDDVKQYIKIKKIKNVSIIDGLTQKKLVKYYQKASIFITASLTETFGFTLLEALSCGTPILFPHCEVFDRLYGSDFEHNGFDINNNNDFLRAFNYIMSNQNKATYQKCREYAMQRGWKSVCNDIINIYQTVIDFK